MADTTTLLRQAMDALHPQANRAFVEATRDALRAALAAPVEPVAWHRERFNLPAWADSLERSIRARKVSARDVCAATGIMESSLSRIRAGKHAPDAASLAALSAWAGINPVSFCTIDTPPAQPAPAPEELSPEFTDTARAALLWVLWHHQGASSAVGQPIRFALGMGAHDRLNEHQIAEAKRWATTTGSTTAEFHKVPAAPAVSAVWTPEELDAAKQRAKDTAAWLLQNAPAAPAVPDPWKSAVLDRLAATCMDAQQDEPPASILRRIIDWEVTVALDPAVSDIAPYLCIKPACGPDCSGCNCAISPQDMRDYAVRYAILRNAPIDAIRDGGVFAGKTPDNVVINGEHLDAAVDALRGITGDSK